MSLNTCHQYFSVTYFHTQTIHSEYAHTTTGQFPHCIVTQDIPLPTESKEVLTKVCFKMIGTGGFLRITSEIGRHRHGFKSWCRRNGGSSKATLISACRILLYQISILPHQKFMFILHQKVRLKVSKMHIFHVFCEFF